MTRLKQAAVWLVLLVTLGGLWLVGGQTAAPPLQGFTPEPFPALEALHAVPQPAVLLTTWASWCAVCMAEMPKKIDYAQAHPTVALVALNIDTVASAKEAALRTLNPPALKNIFWRDDPSRTVAFGTLQGSGVPESYVLNAKRQLLIKQSGPLNLEAGAFADALRQAQQAP